MSMVSIRKDTALKVNTTSEKLKSMKRSKNFSTKAMMVETLNMKEDITTRATMKRSILCYYLYVNVMLTYVIVLVASDSTLIFLFAFIGRP